MSEAAISKDIFHCNNGIIGSTNTKDGVVEQRRRMESGVEWFPGDVTNFSHPINMGTSALTSTGVGGKYCTPHWRAICDNVGTNGTDQLPSFKEHDVPPMVKRECLDKLAQCMATECIPEGALRDVPPSQRDRSWLFLNPYTLLFKVSCLFPIPIIYKRLHKRWVSTTNIRGGRSSQGGNYSPTPGPGTSSRVDYCL